MNLNNQEILFLSLQGTEKLNLIEDLKLLGENYPNVAPVLPFPFKTNETNVSPVNWNNPVFDSWKQKDMINEEKQFFPLSFSFTETGTKFLFPYEPLVSISGGKNIKKRNVSRSEVLRKNSKGQILEQQSGTVKERFIANDFQIDITGLLVGENMIGNPNQCFPKKQMIDLFEFLIHVGSIYVYHYQLSILGINKIVIEDYSFPFTKGENVQAFNIKCLSDSNFKLEITEADL